MEILGIIAKNSSGQFYPSPQSAGWRTLPNRSENDLISCEVSKSKKATGDAII
jgi:hypothetical protein